MPNDASLTVSLAEFGLGKYEAQAYVTLLTKGPMSASDLAYYAKMPRTKVYPVLLRLEKKHLATMTRGKPVMCSAMAPHESFDEAIGEQINKVNAMNSLVEELKTLCEGAKHQRGTQKRKYLHISHSKVLEHTQAMIQSAGSTIHGAVDPYGLDLLSECSTALAAATRRGVKTMIMATPATIGSPELRNIARIADVRISELEQNCVVFDGTSVLIAGGKAGKAALFESSEILGGEQDRMFASLWTSAIDTDALTVISKPTAQEAYRAIRLVEKMGLNHTLCSVISSKNAGMFALLEDNGIHLQNRNIEDVVTLVDAAVRTTCSGSVLHDSKNAKILVESKLNHGHSLPWARIIEGYLDASGIRARLVYRRLARRGEQVHIKMG